MTVESPTQGSAQTLGLSFLFYYWNLPLNEINTIYMIVSGHLLLYASSKPFIIGGVDKTLHSLNHKSTSGLWCWLGEDRGDMQYVATIVWWQNIYLYSWTIESVYNIRTDSIVYECKWMFCICICMLIWHLTSEALTISVILTLIWRLDRLHPINDL